MEIEFRSSLNGLNIKSKPYILLNITYSIKCTLGIYVKSLNMNLSRL